MSLPMAIASSTVLNVVTDSTGPKISSWKMRILLWPTNTVGLHVVAVLQLAAEMRPLAAGRELRAFLLADIDVAQDLLELAARRLRAHLGGRIERMAHA